LIHVPNVITITNLKDPRLADYLDVKERQLSADFGAPGPDGRPGGTPDAPHGKLYAEGPLVLEQLLKSSHRLLSLLTTAPRLEDLGLPLPHDLPVYLLPQRELDRVIGFNIHRGLLGIAARAKPQTLVELLAHAHTQQNADSRRPGPLVVLEDLSNHDNVGSIFRHAAAFGAAGVILSARCADPLYRKSIRVSIGHALRVPWAWAPTTEDPSGLGTETLVALATAGWTTLALTPAGDRDLDTMIKVGSTIGDDRPIFANFAIVIGAEGPGLSAPTLAVCNLRVRIPMASGVDSLNAATTAAIALYELTRLRR